MKKRSGRAVSFLLCLALLLGMIAPVAAAAAEDAVDLEAGLSESQDILQSPDHDEYEIQAVSQSSDSDKYEIYPTPQSVVYGTGTVTLLPTMQVTYGAGIDDYTKDRAVEAFEAAGVTLDESATTSVKLQVSIGITSNAGKYDAYDLTINAGGITVVGKDTDAAFYGLTTVKRILQQVKDRTVRQLTVADYADVPFRGFIEGYYGNPWTVDDRTSLMEFGGEYKMNIYFYAPKDDPKHNSQWREEYTQKELDEIIKPLAEAGNESKCYFGFALHPFMHDPIRFDSEEHYQADLEILEKKFEQAMGVGVRQIAVLGDDADVPTDGTTTVNSEGKTVYVQKPELYVKLMKDLTDWVASPEMQAKYPGLKTSIPFCPADYMGNGNSAQLQALKALPDTAPVILTGGKIWGHVSHDFLSTYKTNTNGGRTFMWVNWPCSDNSKASLTMGAHDVILHDDLTQADIDTLQGVMINPMQQSEPSKAGIFQLADYTWNIWNGSDKAQRKTDVWNDCFKYVDHDSALETDESTALRELSKHMIRQNGNGNNNYSESVELAATLSAFRTRLAEGTLTAADIDDMRAEFAKLNDAATTYNNEEKAGNRRILGARNGDGYKSGDKSLNEQMAPWLDCWEEFTHAGIDLLDALKLIAANSNGANNTAIVEKYLSGQSQLTDSQGHAFWYVNHYEYARVGGQHLEPFVNALLASVAEVAQTIVDPNGQSAPVLTLTTSGDFVIRDGSLANAIDGSTSTDVQFSKSNSDSDPDKDKFPANAWVKLDLGASFALTGISILQDNRASGGDRMKDAILEYSNDDTAYTTIASNLNSNSIEQAVNITARYIRLRNGGANTNGWLRLAEFGVTVAVPTQNDNYQSDTVKLLANPVRTLTEDSASLSSSAVMLRPNEFVGIALPRIQAITDIVANYTADSGIVLEVGMSEAEMEEVNLSARTAYSGGYARYIRLRNASERPISFKLTELSVEIEAGPSDFSYVEAHNCEPEASSDDPMLWFDGDLSTNAKFRYQQRTGNWVLFDMGKSTSINSLRATILNTDNDYPRNGVWEVSGTKEGPWTTVLTITTTLGSGQNDYNNPPATNGSVEWKQDTANFFYQENILDTPVEGRYLRYRVTSNSENYLRFNEITINGGVYSSNFFDPTYVADPIEVSAACTPDKMRDGDLTTGFRPNMADKTEGSLIYRLSDTTSIGQINVVMAGSGVKLSVRPVGESDFRELGTLTSGLTQVSVPEEIDGEEIAGVAEIKLSWGNTTPIIYELITVPREAAAGEGGQTSSSSEVVPINSYSGSDCSILFDENWKFSLGDTSGAQAKVYNDSTWRTVDLPHDFSIEQEYTSAGEAESGYLLGGTGWYRKSFTVDSSWEGKTVTIDFGGAYMDTEVYLNGVKLGEHHYGYTPFSFKLSNLDYTGENVLAVKVTNPVPSSRWYSGSGIYRSVHLTVSEPVHVAKYGTKVETTNDGAVTVKTTVQNDGAAAANVTVEQAVYELDGATFEKKVGAVATASGAAAAPAANSSAEVTQTLNVASPKLWNSWDKGEPNLYVLVTTVKQGSTVLDTYETEFGFRTIQFTVNEGFKLNGENLKLKGVCQHHDQGALGAEAWYRALERQVEILMDMGCNSIRVTHNPAADELIEICNRKGVLVIDEAFDGWHIAKNGNSGDFARWFNVAIEADNALVGKSSGDTWAKFVLQTMVKRDMNNPCVIMYSLGNEVQEGAGGYTYEDSNRVTQYRRDYITVAKNLIAWAQAIDTNIPITRGTNGRSAGTDTNENTTTDIDGAINQLIHEAGGVVGFNYYGGSSNPILPGHNNGWRMYASETASHVNSRGVYTTKANAALNSDKLLTAYDKSAVSWGATASDAWWRTIQYDYSAGEYVWTGFDYIGEPSPANRTSSGWVDGDADTAPKSSFFGAIDTNGLPKDNYWLYRSMWNDKAHTLHILPTWDREDLVIENGNVEVVVYTDAPMVKLYLNGTEVGSATATTRTTAAGHVYRTFNSGTGAFVQKAATSHETLYATFNVHYEAGTLKAVACDASGNELTWVTEGRSEVKTTSGASKLVLSSDRDTIKNDGRDLSYVTISITDDDGNIVNSAKNEVTVSVAGDGVLMGLDNGVQSDHTSYLSSTRRAGAGQLVAIVQSTKKEGSFTVTARANGLTAGSTTVATSGAASTVDEDAPVSYDLTKTIYVQLGVEPKLPKTIEVTLGNGTTVPKNVTWDDSWNRNLLNMVGSEFAITGTIADYNIPVSVGVVVVDNVVALLNYSTAVQVGETPALPGTRPAVMADGAVLNAQFPVEWAEPAAGAYNREGTVEITGEAEVFGKTLTVTAWVRVAKGGVAEGGSVSNDVRRPVVNNGSNDELNDELLKAYDGNDNTAWTGSGTTNVAFDTAQNLYRIKLTYQGTPPTTGVTITLDDGPVTVSPTIAGSTATYELDGIHSSVNVTLTFASTVTLAEVELIVGTPTFDVYSTAELDGLKFNGENASPAELAARMVKTSLLAPDIVPVSSRNVAYTILPENADGSVIIVTESENQASRDLYTVQFGALEAIEADDDSRDYPYSQTTAYAPSAENGDPDGPASWAVDGDTSTFWHSAWSSEGTGSTNLTNKPEERYIQLTLDEAAELVALRYKPRPTVHNGIVTKYRVEISTDGERFTPVATGDWAHDTAWKVAMFDQVATAKYVRLYGVETQGDVRNKFMSCAELRVVTANDDDKKEDLSLAMVTVSPEVAHWRNVVLYPETVTVTLFGKELEEGKDYTLQYANNRDPGTAHVYAIAKADSKYRGSAHGTFTIVRTDAAISSFEERTIWIQEGIAPELPETVWASMSDGHHQAQDVVWDSVPSSKYMNPDPAESQFTVFGTVEGTELRPELTVNVAYAQSADSVSAMTAVGVVPSLPKEVNVQFNDGSSRKCGVTWVLAGKDWNTEDDIVEVTGTVEGIARVTAKASVRVAAGSAEKLLSQSDPADTNVNQFVNTSIFPFAMAWHSSGNNNPYVLIDGTVSSSWNAGWASSGEGAYPDRWSDWESGHTHDQIWAGVAFESATTLTGRTEAQTLTLVNKVVDRAVVRFIDENASTTASSDVTYPATYEIQYYTGPTKDLVFDTRLTTGDGQNTGNGRVRGWTGSPLLDDSNWQTVTYTETKPAIVFDSTADLNVTFEPVTTSIIRVKTTHRESKWVGMTKLEVYGMDLPEANSDFTVTSVKLGDVEKLNQFDDNKVLNVELDENEAIPVLSVTADKNASVSITQASQVPGIPQPGVAWATATITSEDGSMTEKYTVKFTRKGAPEGYPIAVTGPDAAKITLSAKSAAPGEEITVTVPKGYELSDPWVVITWCAHGNIHAGQHIDMVGNKFIMPEGNVEFRARVNAIAYKITYELNGGEPQRDNPTEYTVEANGITLSNPVKEGFTFTGWTGTGLPDEEPYTMEVTIPKGSTGERSYTAHWKSDEPDSYTITYTLNGGTLAEPNPDSYTSETLPITLKNPVRAGFTFTGWTGGTGLTEPTLTVTIPEGTTGDLSYTANWEEKVESRPNTPVVPVVPEDPTPSKPNDDTTTKVEKNDDGSTTTTVTDNTTGVVTATTERTDGSKVVKVTEANEDVTITVTDAEGEVLAKVELPAEVPEPETRFEDVPEGHWADEAIHNMAALEIVKGVGDDRFDMNGGMTRGALATVLSRLSNGQTGLESSFTDVAADKWYADGIAWAARTGIVAGYSETEFGPNDTITREQLAVMLCRYAKLVGLDTSASNTELDAFADGGDTHGWAADSIAWCVANGILKGMGNNTLAPTATATRAQVAVMLQRFMDLLK